MSTKNLICIVVDRLHAGMVGAYGNSWIHTGQLDHLASESFLFDQAFVDSPDLDQFYRACWLGFPGYGPRGVARGASLPRLLGASGIATTLMTDEALVAHHRLAEGFSDRIFLDTPPTERSAVDILETRIGRLFVAATDWLRSAAEPFCFWLHARGMDAEWDAPLELRNQYADDEDPQPPTFTAVPEVWLPDDYDPDRLLGITHAYAGQISLLDVVVGGFLDQFRDSALAESTQLTFLSARGFPLGEHRRVGACDEPLYNETSQLAWIMRFPDGLGKLARSQALVQPADLPAAMLDWLELDRGQLGGGHASSLLPIVRGDVEALRDRIFLASRRERAIRTPAWLLRQAGAGRPELYAKPGDRWEVNEVAQLCPEVVSGLQAALADWEQSGASGPLSPLAEALVTELD